MTNPLSRALVALSAIAPAAIASPFATAVIDYQPGSNPAAGFTDPSTALGAPARTTDAGFSTGALNTQRSAGGTDQVVSIGAGGSLTVRFDQPVTDDPLNPFGIDLIVFGNAFYFTEDFTPATPVAGIFAEGGLIEVSADGSLFLPITSVAADGAFPTLGYSDLPDAFATEPGSVLTDFTRPVDPAFDATGKTFAEIVDAYDGSGGGAGIDLASVGLSEILYVRITNPLGATATPEIDAFADVAPIPTPSTLALGALALVAVRRRRTTVTPSQTTTDPACARAPHG